MSGFPSLGLIYRNVRINANGRSGTGLFVLIDSRIQAGILGGICQVSY